MASEWKETTLGEILNFRRGHDLPKTKMLKGEYPVVGSNGIIGCHNEFTTKKPCISIGRSGNIGNPILVESDCWSHNTTLYIDDFKGNLPKYIYYFLITLNLKNYGGGSAVPTLNRNHIHPLAVKLPPLKEQKAIAHILGSLDDKIELNRQMNKTLEAMAQALFKSWFVDFDPVIDNALQAGNTIPEALQSRAAQRQALGADRVPLPENVQGLFPSEFVYSEELDKYVPLGWSVENITEIADVIGGGTPSTKISEYFCETGIPWLSPKDLSGYEWKYISRGATDITDLGLAKSSAKLMPKGAVLFSSRAPIGYVAIAQNDISTNQGFKSLVPKNGMSSEYLFYFLKTNTESIEAIATGSTFKEVSGAAIKSLKVLVPEQSILDYYKKSTDDYNSRRQINQDEVYSLTKLRDTLLPKLISGEVRVGDEMIKRILND